MAHTYIFKFYKHFFYLFLNKQQNIILLWKFDIFYRVVDNLKHTILLLLQK